MINLNAVVVTAIQDEWEVFERVSNFGDPDYQTFMHSDGIVELFIDGRRAQSEQNNVTPPVLP